MTTKNEKEARAERLAALGAKILEAVTESYLETGKGLDAPALAARLQWSEGKVRRCLDELRGAPNGVSTRRELNDNQRNTWFYYPALWHLRDVILAMRETSARVTQTLRDAAERATEALGSAE